ncbi:MAG: hypothetical protein U0798_07415 [Gemmataceae bacterium]
MPRGFVREHDPRHSELKDLLPGIAERYPGLPADSYLLSFTGGVITRVAEACDRIGLTISPLRDFCNLR